MAPPKELLRERIDRVQEALAGEGGAPILVTDPANVGWLTGVPEDFRKDARALVFPDRCVFVTDARYETRIPEIPGVEPFLWGAGHPHAYPDLRTLLDGTDTLLLDEKGLPLSVYAVLPRMLGVRRTRVPAGFLALLRMVKGAREIALVREAVDLAIRQFRFMVNEWLPAHRDATDMEFRDALEEWPLDKGGEGPSFDAIVAMDADADAPHADMTRPARPLRDGKAMLVDWGIVHRGVCTDMTRMVYLSDDVPDRIREMEALQERWMAEIVGAIGPGRPASDAGDVYVEGLRAAGIERPPHGAGHGTGGAYVHELPVLGPKRDGYDDFGIPFGSAIALEPGMIVTVEPGIYERGFGAYRTENMVLVTDDGNEILDAALPRAPFRVE